MMKVLYISASALGLLVLRPGTAHATSYVVTTNVMTSAADGACSLVEAVTASNTGIAQNECQAGTGNDEIRLSGGTYVATASLRPTRTLTISGMGTSIIAAAFNGKPGSYLVGVIGANANLTIDNVTLRNDTTDANRYLSGIYASAEATVTSNDRLRVTGFNWSGIYATNAQVFLTHALIDRNSSSNPTGVGHGGGIYVDSSGGGNHAFVFNHSSAVYNTALNDGGGIYFAADGGSHFFYSTFAKNSAKRGGGLFVGTKTGGYFEARHITVGRNNATVSGGGVYEQHNASGLFFMGSIISNNTLNNNASATTANMFRQAQAGNSFDNIWGAGVTASSIGCAPAAPNWNCSNNLYGTDAKLASDPISMGGAYYSMPVLMPLKGSPAIDYGAGSGAEPLDQRGMNGNIDGDGNGTVAIDAGAIERNQIWQSEETREWVNSSSDLVNIDVGGYPTGQLGRRLSANATNDYVSYAVPIPEAGAYDITVKFKRASDGGKFKVGTASASNGAYDETGFAEQNGYSAATTLPAAVTLGSRTFNAPGKYWIRFRVSAAGTGGGRALFQDYIKVRKTN